MSIEKIMRVSAAALMLGTASCAGSRDDSPIPEHCLLGDQVGYAANKLEKMAANHIRAVHGVEQESFSDPYPEEKDPYLWAQHVAIPHKDQDPNSTQGCPPKVFSVARGFVSGKYKDEEIVLLNRAEAATLNEPIEP